MNEKQRELQACLVLLDKMIERAKRFNSWFEANIRNVPLKDPCASIADYDDRIWDSEIRALDLECKKTLERLLPAYPQIARDWHVHEDPSSTAPHFLVQHLENNRIALRKAIELSA